MQKLVEVKRRMSAVRSIRSVARTMATVASAKLSRSRERAAGIRSYTEEMRGVVQRQQAYAAGRGLDITDLSPYLVPRPEVRKVLLLHLSGDRGMCGGYNSAINRLGAYVVTRFRGDGVDVGVIAKGTKGERHLRLKAGARIVEAQTWPRAGVTAEEVDAMCERLSEAFLSGEADEVWCAYTRFYSPLRRQPRVVRLLPIVFEEPTTDVAGEHAPDRPATVPGRWFYEPDLAPILSELLATLLRMQIEDVLLESYASEQGARMITMEEATERADRTLQELTVQHNRLRREVITGDLIGVLFASHLREEAEATGAAAEGAR